MRTRSDTLAPALSRESAGRSVDGPSAMGTSLRLEGVASAVRRYRKAAVAWESAIRPSRRYPRLRARALVESCRAATTPWAARRSLARNSPRERAAPPSVASVRARDERTQDSRTSPASSHMRRRDRGRRARAPERPSRVRGSSERGSRASRRAPSCSSAAFAGQSSRVSPTTRTSPYHAVDRCQASKARGSGIPLVRDLFGTWALTAPFDVERQGYERYGSSGAQLPKPSGGSKMAAMVARRSGLLVRATRLTTRTLRGGATVTAIGSWR